VPGDTPWLQNVARVGAEMHHVKLGDTGNSVVAIIQAIADLANATIASDQVLTLDLFSPAGFDVLHGRNHGIWTLNKLFEGNAESGVDRRFCVDRPLQYWLDGDLGDPHCRLHRL
jgi:hypothetical protein